MSSSLPPSWNSFSSSSSCAARNLEKSEESQTNFQNTAMTDTTGDFLPLTNPGAVPKSSRDPNKGLYPRSKRKSKCAPGFSKASELCDRLNTPAVSYNRQKSDRLNKIDGNKPFTSVQHSIKFHYGIFERKDSGCITDHSKHKYSTKKRKRVDDNDGNKSKNTVRNYFKPVNEDNSSCLEAQQCNKGHQESSCSLHTFPENTCKQKLPHEMLNIQKNVDLKSHSQETTCIPSTSKEATCIPSTSKDDENTEVFDSAGNAVWYTKFESDNVKKNKDSHFGLFGIELEEFSDTTTPCYFEHLPPAVIEQILCQIPFRDLLNLRSVCKSWERIISDQKFAEWKKAYYHLKWTNDLHSSLPKELCDHLHEYNVNDCFTTLIRYMTCTFNRRASPQMMDWLKKLPKCDIVTKVIAERLPDLATRVFNPWGVIAGMALISESIWDIMAVLKHLCCNGSPCSLHDVLDVMYCIATFLLYFKNTFKVNHGIHYRVYYALYLWENSVPQSSTPQVVAPEMGICGQQSLYNYCKPTEQRLTYEQIRVLNHRLKPNQVVKIVAFAGSGKTSTLIHFARLYPQLHFLNVVFNKGVCTYASKCFSSNVECRTAHSLAYQAIGKRYRHKLTSRLKPYDILSLLNKPEGMKMHIYAYAKCVLQTVECFMMSSDEDITIAHVPQFSLVPSPLIPRLSTREELTDSERLNFRKEADALWKKMVDQNDVSCRITHDTYLKIFQLSKPKFLKYNCIMIDEAQDCNAAMLDIMLSQDVPVILVGDPHQQIYGFRGANNALERVQATHVYHLTKSFRFGPEIAYVASCCMEVLKGHNRTTLVGCEKKSFVNGNVMGQYAVIARTNFRLYEEAVRLCCTNVRRHDEPEAIHAAFAGGISGYGFDQIVDIYRLSSGEQKDKIKDKFVKKFSCFSDLASYAKKSGDADLLSKVDLVTQYGHAVVDQVRTIKKKGSCAMELANVVFSTAHKSKGLEFDTVCLADDFHITENTSDRLVGGSNMGEEYNVLYVALTRAKRCLLMSETLYRVLLEAQEKFEYPVSSKDVLQEYPSPKCMKCHAEFIPHTVLSVVRRKLMLATRRKINGGPLCMKCATAPFYRPEVHRYPAVVILDRVADTGHRSMCSLVGPLPSDPPIQYDIDLDFVDDIGVQPLVFQINVL